MNARSIIATLLTGALLSTGCADEDGADETAATDTAQAPARPMPGMGPGGMAGMQSTAMMTQMAAHMQQMQTAGADSMMRMLPGYRQSATDMLSQMNREMRDRNMQGDARWDATIDSLQQDLARMPQLSAEEMQALMPAHHARMTRLMEMHRGMMPGMPR